jgi:hypothetical protein
MSTTTSGSADKGLKELLSLSWPEASDAAGLSDGGALHDASRLHLANRGQGTDEVVGAHLRDALLILSEDKQLFERKFARLHHFLHLGTASTIGDRRARRGNSLFVSEGRGNWSHEVRIPPVNSKY